MTKPQTPKLPKMAYADSTTLVDVGGGMYVQFPEGEKRGKFKPLFWHKCLTTKIDNPKYIPSSIGSNHKILSEDPVTISPSLVCGNEGCPVHGFIENGKWRDV